MDTKKIITILLVALAIYVIFNDPEGSAGGVQAVFDWLRGAAQSLIVFLRNLFA